MNETCTNSPASLDDLFKVLANQRRRYVLYYLQTASDDVVRFNEVVTQIANWETPPDTEPTTDHIEKIRIALQHNHLPKLEDHGIIDYDSRSEMIRYWNDLKKQTWLEQAKTEEINTEGQSASRLDEETVTTALKSTLKTAYDTDVELTRSFSCYTDPPYPDWDVTITEVNRPLEDT